MTAIPSLHSLHLVVASGWNDCNAIQAGPVIVAPQRQLVCCRRGEEARPWPPEAQGRSAKRILQRCRNQIVAAEFAVHVFWVRHNSVARAESGAGLRSRGSQAAESRPEHQDVRDPGKEQPCNDQGRR